MKKAYVEIAFWLTTVAGVLGIVSQSLTGYPGDLIPQESILIIGITQAVLSFIAAAVLNRSNA